MEKSFSVTLTELRKEKRLTQKEAAAKLGVSQALLSHYEKGIRECSREFLIKAADFYGVSCDYLLGRTTERTGEIGFDIHKAIPGDFVLSSETLERAFIALIEMLERGKDEKLNLLVAAELYRLIIMCAGTGFIPEKWVAGSIKTDLPQLLDVSETFIRSRFASLKSKLPAPKRKAAPVCVQTVASQADDWLRDCLFEMLKKDETV